MPTAIVARFTFPRDLDAVRGQIEECETLDFVSLVLGEPLSWVMPKWCMTGDVVVFQLGLRSPANFRACMRAAVAQGEDWIAGDVLEPITDLVQEYAGCLVAIGQVEGESTYGYAPAGAEFSGRSFAPIDGIQFLPFPVSVVGASPLARLPVFLPIGPVTHRAFDSEESYRKTLGRLTRAGNRVPRYATGLKWRSSSASESPQSWANRLSDPDVGFVTEAQLSELFAVPLLRRLSDGDRIKREVGVRSNTTTATRPPSADFVIWVGGRPVPVEAKINVLTEPKILRQVTRYTGPDKTLALRPPTTIDHNVGLVIDQRGAYIVEGGRWALSAPEEPALRRVDIGKPRAITEFRSRLEGFVEASARKHSTPRSRVRQRN